jgi:hypothetical protein
MISSMLQAGLGVSQVFGHGFRRAAPALVAAYLLERRPSQRAIDGLLERYSDRNRRAKKPPALASPFAVESCACCDSMQRWRGPLCPIPITAAPCHHQSAPYKHLIVPPGCYQHEAMITGRKSLGGR